MTVKIGFIGTGEIAEIHRRALAELNEDIQIAGAFDLDPQTAVEFARRAGAECYPSADALLAAELDAVYICTRHDSHSILVQAAAKAGVAVFCEKPLALTEREALQAAAAVRAAGIPFVIGYNHRFSPGMIELQRRFRSESPSSLHLSLVTPQFLRGWAGQPRIGGGVLHCLGSHVFDLACAIMGSAPEALAVYTARQRLDGEYLPDTAAGMLRFPRGQLVSVLFHDGSTAAFSTAPESALVQLQAYYKEATASGYPLREMTFTGSNGIEKFSVTSQDPVVAWGYQAINAAFIGYLKKEIQKAPVSIDDGLRAVKMVHAALSSQQRGRETMLHW